MLTYKNFIKTLIILIAATGLYFLGYSVGHNNLEFEKNLIPKVVNKELFKPDTIDFSLFWEAWDKIEDKFVGQADPEKMIYGAVSGMAASLDDPYTLFMKPGENEQFIEDLKGEFDGIGAEIGIRDQKLMIVAPLDESPAQKAGIRAKDIIVKINDEEADKLSFNEAIMKIRGIKGTEVKLTIFREGEENLLEIKVIRDTIKIESVKSETCYQGKNAPKDQCVAYIKVRQFGDDTTELLKKALNEADDKQAKGTILDLRNNPGGYLEAAIDISSLLIPREIGEEKTVVIEKYKRDKQDKFSATLQPILSDGIKMAVLVNKGSASASEIVSGALQDHKKAIIIGETTFGKGSVQELLPLKDKSAVRVTVAKWLTPNGREINGKGLEPDIKVKISEEDIKNDKDPQLERAIQEVLK